MPFPFARQFTAPPFFMGLEDAQLKGKLLLDAVQRTRKAAAVPAAKKRKVASVKKGGKVRKKK